MRLLIMNSAVMVSSGRYIAREITLEEAKSIMQAAKKENREIVSYIGYPETARLVSELLEIDVPVNRTETVYKNGDVILVAKLRYRVKDPNEKGKIEPTVDDLMFMVVFYEAFDEHE